MYDVIGLPPSSVGAFQEILMDVLDMALVTRLVTSEGAESVLWTLGSELWLLPILFVATILNQVGVMVFGTETATETTFIMEM
jgi:hypothetical protein